MSEVNLGRRLKEDKTCWGVMGHWEGKIKKYMSHTLKSEDGLPSHTNGEAIVNGKGMRSLTPAFEF